MTLWQARVKLKRFLCLSGVSILVVWVILCRSNSVHCNQHSDRGGSCSRSHSSIGEDEVDDIGGDRRSSMARLWALMCFVRWSERANALVQCGQLWGLSPVCERRCRANSSDRENRQSQPSLSQTNGFSPVCRRMWAFKCELLVYTFPQPGYWHACLERPDAG